jgi:hypothetical protein
MYYSSLAGRRHVQYYTNIGRELCQSCIGHGAATIPGEQQNEVDFIGDLQPQRMATKSAASCIMATERSLHVLAVTNVSINRPQPCPVGLIRLWTLAIPSLC